MSDSRALDTDNRFRFYWNNSSAATWVQMDAASALVTPGPADAIWWWKGKPTEASHFCAYSGQFAVESRQTELAIWTNPHPSSAVRGQSQCPPHHSFPSQMDLEEPPQRIYVTEVCVRTDRRETFIVIHRISRRFSGNGGLSGSFLDAAPPPKPPHHTSSAVEMKRRSVPCF